MNCSIILTTIFEPNDVVYKLSDLAKSSNTTLVIAGDKKTPNSFHKIDCKFLSLEEQCSLFPEFGNSLPINHYVRKNIAYLYSFKNGVKRIVETDDDNYPLDNFLSRESKYCKCDLVSGTQWINIYKLFSECESQYIWPRGFPLEVIKQNKKYQIIKNQSVFAPVQQGLANDNPDVDAIYRMVNKLPLSFHNLKEFALNDFSWCPFNSQVTTWFKEAFPLMYLPSSCTFRMTDIWRSFIAQRILWENDSKLLFHSPSARQERNEHDLLKDFIDEIPGYKNNQIIVDCLISQKLKPGWDNLNYNLIRCYVALVEIKIFDSNELTLLNLWLESISNL